MVTFLVRVQSIMGSLMKKTLGSRHTNVSERTDNKDKEAEIYLKTLQVGLEKFWFLAQRVTEME